jgi:hypothetical protein
LRKPHGETAKESSFLRDEPLTREQTASLLAIGNAVNETIGDRRMPRGRFVASHQVDLQR